MSTKRKPRCDAPGKRSRVMMLAGSGLLFFVLVVAVLWARSARRGKASWPGPIASKVAAPAAPQTISTQATTNHLRGLPTMPVNEAVMVTVELDFGPHVPSIAEALRDVERRHQPDDGTGRVFAILDAYGQPTPDGEKLHMSMHVSAEKPGVGALLFRRTGEVLWENRIVPGPQTNAFSGRNLTILLNDGTGKMFMVDGSGNPASILDAHLREGGLPVREFWPDDAEREVSFIYSSCGCPVKVSVRRIGERTSRTKEVPVIFPDDPAVVRLIDRLMGWSGP